MSQPGQNEIERMIVNYRDQRRAEGGAPLELHKAARQKLHDEVESQFGTGLVSAQESAEKFARTLAWQQNLGRWWHGLVPKIGFAGACFAAVMVVFSIAHREAQQDTPARVTSDFLEAPPLAEIVPESAMPLEDVHSTPPPPVSTEPAPPAPTIALEPRPEPAAMLEDRAPARLRQPSPKPPANPPAAVRVAPPQWSAKTPASIEVNIPDSLLKPDTVVVTPLPAPIAATPGTTPFRDTMTERAEPLRGRLIAPATAPATATPAITRSQPSANPPPPGLRGRFVTQNPQPLLRRFDLVLENGTVSFRDEDGSIYRGKAVSTASGDVAFTAHGRHRGSGDDVNLVGTIAAGGTGLSPVIKADVKLGDGSRFAMEAASL